MKQLEKKPLLKWNLEGTLNGHKVKEVQCNTSYEEALSDFQKKHEGIEYSCVTGDIENIDKI